MSMRNWQNEMDKQGTNKRIGTHMMFVFLKLNNVELEYEDDELIVVILSIALGDMDDERMREWIENHIIHE